MRSPSDQDLATLPHILLTSDDTGNPLSLDNAFSVEELILDAPETLGDQDPCVTPTGEYTGNLDKDIDLIIDRRMEVLDSEMPDLL